LVAIPAAAATLARVLRPVHTQYTQYFNRQVRSLGRLWQGRFFSCSLDADHLWTAIRYVERNPVRAGIVSRAEDYPWSSAAHHCGLRKDPIISPLPVLRPHATADWSSWLADLEDDDTLSQIRLHTRSGRRLAQEDFLKDLESAYGSRVWAKTPGRPRKCQSLA
jgi:putative transposase